MGYMAYGPHGQWSQGTMCTPGMGHMGNGVQGYGAH